MIFPQLNTLITLFFHSCWIEIFFFQEDDKKEDGGSSKHSEAELTEDDSARESDDPANTVNMLAQSALSAVLSDSIPNSPASLSH